MPVEKFIQLGREQLILDPDALKRGQIWPAYPGMSDVACINCGHPLPEFGTLRKKYIECTRCGEVYEIESRQSRGFEGASIPRAFCVMQLRTLGPSNSIRGKFLGEIIQGNEAKVRVWNKAQRKWTNRYVDINDPVEVADYRFATYSDLKDFGYKLPSNYHLI